VLLSITIGIGIAVIAAAVVINVVITPGHRSTRTAAASTPSAAAAVPTSAAAPATAAADVATPGCEQSAGADHASGTGVGGTTDAPSVILAFERAYYVQRSGSAARAVVAADATALTAATIQTGIDQVPAGTRYCVHITRTPAGGGALWAVDLSEQWPGESPATYHQIVTVSQLGGRTLISAIGPA
jgi:hypothetical protein